MTTTKETVWKSEYLKCFNATEAARRAGYSKPNVSGPRNKTKFAAEIKAELDERAMSADELIARTGDIARGDLTAYIHDNGELDIKKLKNDGKGHLLKKYKRTKRTIRNRKGDEETEIETIEAEFYAADAAHDKLMRYHSLYNDKLKVEAWQDEVVELLRSGRIQPEDVALAYPELAEGFFAKAGIALSTTKANASNNS